MEVRKKIDPASIPPFVADYKPYPDHGYVSQYTKEKLEQEAAKNWDVFYKLNQSNFFKDRHWILREFPELQVETTARKNILEVGCGVGNTTFPVLAELKNVFFYSFDFSKTAVDLVKAHKEFDATKCRAFVCDIVTEELPDFIQPNSMDAMVMIFVLSAIAPEHFEAVIAKLFKVLKPGGYFLIRDYAKGDMAELRFDSGRKKISDNFFVRKDGTRAYYSTIGALLDLCLSFSCSYCRGV